MFRKPILNVIEFIYKDGNTYAFSTYLNESNKNYFDLYIYKRKEVKILWLFKFHYYSGIYSCPMFDNHYNYTEIFHYERTIESKIDEYLRSKVKEGAAIRDKFNSEFDGYIGLTNSEKLEVKRLKTIKKIIN